MIAEQTGLHGPRQTVVTGARRAPIDGPHLSQIGLLPIRLGSRPSPAALKLPFTRSHR
jgi:hypothetical protein